MTKDAVLEKRTARRVQAHAATRSAILEAARRVAVRGGARELSLRGVAAEAGFAPAALYGYFTGKDELLLAMAAEDLSNVARAMREAGSGATDRLAAAAGAALDQLRDAEALAAALMALPGQGGTEEAERLFNGRLIAVLKVLSDVSGNPAATRDGQRDVVLLAATLAGLALLARSGRLDVLGFSADELTKRLERVFED